MSITRSYLFSAQNIIEAYDGSLPFTAWVKNYFKEHKKFGSRDRKNILQLCFGYFRLGKAFSSMPVQEKIVLGFFLTVTEENNLLRELAPEWCSSAQLSPEEKIKLVEGGEEINKIFSFKGISQHIELISFQFSHLKQPLLFLRSRPGKEKFVLEKINENNIPFAEPLPGAISLPIGTKIEEFITLNRDAVVQDLNSQQILLIKGVLPAETPLKAWDCCAASGGKSILLADHFPASEIWVSDIRPSIIANLKKRFSEAGIRKYHAFVADISRPDFSIQQKFDLVICDAPCSGSGTWSRTPEQLQYFHEEKIGEYANLQKKISSKAIRQLNKGGYFLYITCSVFEAENEEVVQHILHNSSVELVSQQYFKGYDKKADTLFAALFRS
jgi:16S rRNA (cytosine967-C5)-methyltransferase